MTGPHRLIATVAVVVMLAFSVMTLANVIRVKNAVDHLDASVTELEEAVGSIDDALDRLKAGVGRAR